MSIQHATNESVTVHEKTCRVLSWLLCVGKFLPLSLKFGEKNSCGYCDLLGLLLTLDLEGQTGRSQGVARGRGHLFHSTYIPQDVEGGTTRGDVSRGLKGHALRAAQPE